MTALRKPDPEAIYASHYDEVIAGDYNPNKADNISEALSEADEVTKAAIQKALDSGDDLEAIRLIKRTASAYWERAACEYAAHQTQQDIDRWNTDALEAGYARRASFAGREY